MHTGKKNHTRTQAKGTVLDLRLPGTSRAVSSENVTVLQATATGVPAQNPLWGDAGSPPNGLCNHDPCSCAKGPLSSRYSPQIFDDNPFILGDTSINQRHLQGKAIHHPEVPPWGFSLDISSPNPHPTRQ